MTDLKNSKLATSLVIKCSKNDWKKFYCFCLLLLSLFVSAQRSQKFEIGYKSSFGNSTGRTEGLTSNNSKAQSFSLKKVLHEDDGMWIENLSAEKAGFLITYTYMNGIVRDGEGYGKSVGIISEIDFRLLKKNNFSVLFSPGVGIAYVDKTTFTHPRTYIFGSHFNGIFKAGISAEYEFADDLSIILNSDFQHYSNGSVQLPNAGVNILSAGIGITKKFVSKTNIDKRQNHPGKNQFSKHSFEISVGAGKRGKYQMKNSDDLRIALYTGYRYQINQIFGLKGGIDGVWFQNTYDPDEFRNTIVYLGASEEHWRFGARIGGDITLGKVAVGAAIGRYLYFKNPFEQKIYWITDLKYHFTPNFGIEGVLHINKFQADFASWGLFYRL